MKPSPPSATMTSAVSGECLPYSAWSSASACSAAGASLATKAMLRSCFTGGTRGQSWEDRGRRSTARDAHMATDGGTSMAPVDDEVMALGLARDRGADRLFDQRVVRGQAERRAEIGGVLLSQAHEKRAGAGQPHAITALAEIMGEGGDHAEALPGL